MRMPLTTLFHAAENNEELPREDVTEQEKSDGPVSA
jgi:hypothetical protein